MSDDADKRDDQPTPSDEAIIRRDEEQDQRLADAVGGLLGPGLAERIMPQADFGIAKLVADLNAAGALANPVPDLLKGLSLRDTIGGSAASDFMARVPNVEIPSIDHEWLEDLPVGGAAQLEELARIGDATDEQRQHLATIVQIMTESVRLSREATRAAQATAEEAKESQKLAAASIRVARASIWIVVALGIVQIAAAVIVPLIVG